MSVLARVRVVAITDRRLMGDDPADAIRRAVDSAPLGSVLIQIRDKELDGGALYDLTRAAVATGAPVLVNDRLDIALAAGAHGVHLPERGLAVADARRVAPDLIVGVSRHGLDASADGADLIQLGPIWESPGKGPPIGTTVLARTDAFVVAVGGIDSIERAREAFAAGARAVACVRFAWSQPLGPLVEAVERATA